YVYKLQHTRSRSIIHISSTGRRHQSDISSGYMFYASIGAAVLAALGPSRLLRAQTPAGTQIRSITVLTFVGANGLTYSAADTLTLIVGQAGGADVIPQRSVVTDPATTVTFAHTVSNI